MELPIQPHVGGGLPGLMGARLTAPVGKGPQLDDAVHDFVGLLYGYTFSQMRASNDDEEGFFGGANSQMFLGFLDQEVGGMMARAEGAGLAQQMLWQMKQGQGQGNQA